MKHLYAKGKVHPSPPPPTTADHRLSFLPATILTLTVALSPQDKEVLSYLLSCSGSSTNFSGHPNAASSAAGWSGGDHPPDFNCNCFRCYMSYWVKWDASPNRQIIHQILDEYEDGLLNKKKKKKLKVKKERRKRILQREEGESECDSGNSGELDSVEVSGKGDVVVEEVNGEVCEVGCEKGAVRKLMSFIGDRIWGVWGV